MTTIIASKFRTIDFGDGAALYAVTGIIMFCNCPAAGDSDGAVETVMATVTDDDGAPDVDDASDIYCAECGEANLYPTDADAREAAREAWDDYLFDARRDAGYR